MDPGILIPVLGYGGHERLVEMFAKEYNRLGHDVHLLITAGSEVEGCLVHPFGKVGFPPKKWDARMAIPHAWNFLLKHRNEFDIIHNFGRLAYLLPLINHSVKKIMTYGREITARNIKFINKLPNRNIIFTAPSNDCVSSGNASGKWVTIYNAIDFSKYTFVPKVKEDAPLIFLSRLDKVKGCHIAIQVAKATGMKLIIAGNVSNFPDEVAYFKREIEPFIDGDNIQYIGPVNDEQKNYYLGMAKAMLFPIDVREAFGMVMAESMACGTPVIGFAKGAVPEIIINGVNGYCVINKNEMITHLSLINNINRTECYNNAKQRFDVRIISSQYLNLFA